MMSNQLTKSSQKIDHNKLTIETTNMNTNHLETDEVGIEVSIDAFLTPHQQQGNFSMGDVSGDENIQPKRSLSREEQLEIWKNERRIKSSHGSSSTRSNNTNSKSWYGTPSNNSSNGNFSDKSISSHKFANSSGGSVKSQRSYSSNNNSIVSQASATRQPKHHPKSLPLTQNHDNHSFSRPPINHHHYPNHKTAPPSVPRYSIGTFLSSLSRSRATDTSKIRYSISNHSHDCHQVESTNPIDSKRPQLERQRRQSLNSTITPSAPLESIANRKTWSSLECCGNYLPHSTNSQDKRNPLMVTKSSVTNRRCGSCQELSTMETTTGNNNGIQRFRRASVGTNPLDRLSTKLAAQRCMNNSRVEHLEAILSPRQVIPEISFTPLPNTSIVTSPLTCDNAIHNSTTTKPYFHLNDDNDDENSDDLTIGTESLPPDHSMIANWIEHISVDQSPPVIRCETSNEPPDHDQREEMKADDFNTNELIATGNYEIDVPANTPAAAIYSSSCHTDRSINTDSMEQEDEGTSNALLHIHHSPANGVIDPADGDSPSPVDDDLTRIRRSSSESTDPELMCIISSVLETESPPTTFPACIDKCESNASPVAQENENEIVDIPASKSPDGVLHLETAEIVSDMANNDVKIGAKNSSLEHHDKIVDGVDVGCETCDHIAAVPQLLNIIPACHTSPENDIGRDESGNGNSLSESNNNDAVQMCPSPALIAPTLSDCTFQSHFGPSLDSFEDGLVQVYQGTKEEDCSNGTSTNPKFSLEDECPQLEQALQELEAFDWRSELISPVATLLPERRRTDAIEIFLPERTRATDVSDRLSDPQPVQLVGIPSAETPVSLSSDDTAFNWRQELESPLLKPRLKRRKDSSLVPIPSQRKCEDSDIANDSELCHTEGEIDCIETPPSAENQSDPALLVNMKEDDEQRFRSRSIENDNTNISEEFPLVDSSILSPLMSAANFTLDQDAEVPIMRLEGKTMLYPIHEDKSSILSVETFNLLLIENRKLQNQVYELRKSHDERLVPFREFLDEVRVILIFVLFISFYFHLLMLQWFVS